MLRQILYEVKNQKMITWVSITGTSLAIFLIMVFFITDRISTVEIPPENNKSRMMYGGQLEIKGIVKSENLDFSYKSGKMSYKTAKTIYSNLNGVEKISFTNTQPFAQEIGLPKKMRLLMAGLHTDADFWEMYDFSFISGKPYDSMAVEAGERIAVITQSTSEQLFSNDDAIGKQIVINNVPYSVTGVIKDVSPLMRASYAEVYTPLLTDQQLSDDFFGDIMIHVLMKEGIEESEIKKQIEWRFDSLNNEYSRDSIKWTYRNQPYGSEYLYKIPIWGNADPSLSYIYTKNNITYLILLIIWALILSGLLRGRLWYRMPEIGIRRAFGAKRSAIIMQLLGENLIITMIGGIIGLIISFIVVYFAADYFFKLAPEGITLFKFKPLRPEIEMLWTWNNLFIAFIACFVINLISVLLTVGRALKIEPAEAINKSHI